MGVSGYMWLGWFGWCWDIRRLCTKGARACRAFGTCLDAYRIH